MNLQDVVHAWHSAQPHPLAPTLTQGDFPVAMRLATFLKFGQGHAGPQEAANFWSEFQAMNQSLLAQNRQPISPEEFTHVAQQMAKSSFAYHGRPPSMYEIGRLRDANPKDITDYYGALPDEHYPTISAADMAKAIHTARPWANQALGRDPLKLEAAYFASSGHSPADYYKEVARGGSDPTGGNAGAVGAANAGGQQAGQRANDSGVADGHASAGGSAGVSQGGAGGAAGS